MTQTQTGVLVLQDNAGSYFLLPQATLEQGRVPEQHRAEVEQLIAGQQDVWGHLNVTVFQLHTALVSERDGTGPVPAAGIVQAIMKLLEDRARNRPQ